MESSCIDQSDVVYGEIDNFVQSENTWAIGSGSVENVAVALDGSF
jgi:hypothetical protein